jgi:D-alanyl-D-alanine carboxypeptidase
VADKSSGDRLTPRHTHRIASNTKTYVAAAILRLIEDGKLGLDDPMPLRVSAPHVASLRRDGYAVDRITIRHLLNHSAGIYDYAMDERFVSAGTANPTHRWTRSEQLDSAMVWGAPYNAPGDAFHYTDTGYILLGEVIERITGKGLGESLRSLLHYDAIGLRDTWLETLEPMPKTAGPRAAQYMGDLDIRKMDASVDLYGGGGLAATPTDMARFTRALFVGGVFASPSTTTLMTTTRGPQGPRSYAAGIAETKAAGASGWGHSGFWNTWSYHFPDRDLTLAASVTQQGNSAVSRALLEQAVATVLR